MSEYIGKENTKVTMLSLFIIPLKRMPLQAISMLVLTIFDGISLPLQVQVTTNLINQAVELWNGAIVQKTYHYVFLFCMLIGYQWISNDVKNIIKIRLNLSVTEYCNELCISKTASLRYAYVENHECRDLIQRVRDNFSKNVILLFNDVCCLLSLLIHISGILTIIFSQVWWASIVIFVAMLPLSLLIRKASRETYKGEILITENSRHAEYFNHSFSMNQVVDERSFFGFGEYLNNKYKRYYDKAQKVRFEKKRLWFVRMKAGSIVASFVFATILFAFMQPIEAGKITIGFFASISYALFSMIQRLSWELTGYVDHITMVNAFRDDLTNFLQMEEDDHALVMPTSQIPEFVSLEFSHVSFRYPGTLKLVLNDVSFRIEGERCYAFVGENGSGKTTIIKLISGLYDDYSGSIKLNGLDIRNYPAEILRGLVHTLFQDYAKYPITVRDNILLGDVLNLAENEETLIKAMDALHMKEFVYHMPKSLDTTLGRLEEDSVELSGGQWQRIALMRAFVNQAPLKILDEPTAAQDPISESRLYQEFETLMTANVTILISHRLGATKLAQKIFVLQDGGIKEEGTHEELMNLNGIYHSMYESQKAWYAV